MKDIHEFLTANPRMGIQPDSYYPLVLQGYFDFTACNNSGVVISDSYHIRINVPKSFPNILPQVKELDNKILRDGKHHVNEDDDTLCLGSPLRLLYLISKQPSLIGFAEKCLVPYLYGISHKRMFGCFPKHGELDHGNRGLLNDYMELFKLSTPNQVIKALNYLGTKKRHANKYNCPCGCGIRLGRCDCHLRLNEFRKIVSRAQFKKWAQDLLVN